MTFRANTLKTTSGAVANALAQASIDWSPVDFYADAFVVDAADDAKVRSLDIYKNGEIYVQNVSAMLPALVLAPVAGQDVLDMAAAPGGKTSQLAALSQGRANITACEKNPIRADRLRYNLQKQGVTRVNVMQTDARKLDDFFTFDEVLLDSPCSGSGTLQLAYSHNTADDAANDTKSQESSGFSLELFERSQLLQRELLRRALAAVKPGGIVVYSTCSVLPQENEQAIRDALNPKWAPPKSAANNKSHRGKGSSRKSKQPAQAPFAIKAEIVPISDELLQGVPLLPCTLEGAACVKPTSLFEGFFVAALKRLS
jgi:ribosomal RNA methyltransferase Nop2